MGSVLMQHLKAAGYEMNLDQWIVMVHLWRQDGQNQRWLCEFAGQSKTSVTRAINVLESQNVVIRISDKEDRRNKLIYLTNKGKNLKEDMMPMLEEMKGKVTKGIPEGEIEVCKSVLRQMFVNLRAHI